MLGGYIVGKREENRRPLKKYIKSVVGEHDFTVQSAPGTAAVFSGRTGGAAWYVPGSERALYS